MAIDLDAARAARREAQGDAPSFVLDGKTYVLPVEMPFAVLESMGGLQGDDAAGAIQSMAQALLGEHYAEVHGKLSVKDFQVLTEGLLTAYGVDNPFGS